MQIEIPLPNPHGPFDEAAYAEFRAFLPCDLPEDYLIYLRKFNGGKPTNYDFTVVEND